MFVDCLKFSNENSITTYFNKSSVLCMELNPIFVFFVFILDCF
nr:MAG TPA: hypothetical protein [Caudoviricetes sp.]